MAQARQVALALSEAGYRTEIVPMVTKGDQILDRALDQISGKGLFTTELETALFDGRVDVAVHSLKDLPTQPVPGLMVAAYALAEDGRDVLVADGGTVLAKLPAGAPIGTSSLRRTAFLRSLRPDLEVVPVRGNLKTRLAKWQAREVFGLVLAAAGIHRLGLQQVIAEYLSPHEFVPSPGQGILAVETRADDSAAGALAARLDDAGLRLRAVVERTVLATLGGGCQIPLGVWAEVRGGEIAVTARVMALDGQRGIVVTDRAGAEAAERLGMRVGRQLLAAGAERFITGVSQP